MTRFLPKQEATSLLVQQMIAGRLLQHLGDSVDLSTLPVSDVFHELA